MRNRSHSLVLLIVLALGLIGIGCGSSEPSGVAATSAAAGDPSDGSWDTSDRPPSIRTSLGLDRIDSIDDVQRVFEQGGMSWCELRPIDTADGSDAASCTITGLSLRVYVDPEGREAPSPRFTGAGVTVVRGDSWTVLVEGVEVGAETAHQISVVLAP